MSDPGPESQVRWLQQSGGNSHTQGCNGTNTEGAQGLLSQDLTSKDPWEQGQPVRFTHTSPCSDGTTLSTQGTQPESSFLGHLDLCQTSELT